MVKLLMPLEETYLDFLREQKEFDREFFDLPLLFSVGMADDSGELRAAGGVIQWGEYPLSWFWWDKKDLYYMQQAKRIVKVFFEMYGHMKHYALIDKSDREAMRFARKLGFVEEGHVFEGVSRERLVLMERG